MKIFTCTVPKKLLCSPKVKKLAKCAEIKVKPCKKKIDYCKPKNDYCKPKHDSFKPKFDCWKPVPKFDTFSA